MGYKTYPYSHYSEEVVPKPIGKKGSGEMPMYDMPYGVTTELEILRLASPSRIFLNFTTPSCMDSIREIAQKYSLPLEIHTEEYNGETIITGFKTTINGKEYNINFNDRDNETKMNFVVDLINLLLENRDADGIELLFYHPDGELNLLGEEIVERISSDTDTGEAMINNMINLLRDGQWSRDTFDPVFRPFFASSDYLTTDKYKFNIQSKPYKVNSIHISTQLFKKIKYSKDYGVQGIEVGLYIDKKDGTVYIVENKDELPEHIKELVDSNSSEIEVYHYKPYLDLLWWQCSFSGRLRVYGDILKGKTTGGKVEEESLSPYLVVNKMKTIFNKPPKSWYFGIQHLWTYGPTPWRYGKNYQIDIGGELGYAKYSEDKNWIVVGLHGGGSLYLNAITISGSLTRHFAVGEGANGVMDTNITSIGFSIGTEVNNDVIKRVVGDTSVKIYDAHNEILSNLSIQLFNRALLKGGVTYEHWKNQDQKSGIGFSISLTIGF